MKEILHYNEGNTLSFSDVGNPGGFPVLIQHGLIASIEDDHLFASLIKLGLRLVSIARPGYGASSPYPLRNVAEWGDVVARLVDHLKLSQFDVLGMSSGAPYAYSIGYHFPDKARNLFIFSGIPALFDANVAAHWPYPLKTGASIPEMEDLAFRLFFACLPQQDLDRRDIKDSLMNHCFGPALDLRIRCMDWGFTLSAVHQNVYMQHSRLDEGFRAAELTARMLPNSKFVARESGGHFSIELLDEFINTVMAGFYVKGAAP